MKNISNEHLDNVKLKGKMLLTVASKRQRHFLWLLLENAPSFTIPLNEELSGWILHATDLWLKLERVCANKISFSD